MKRKGNIFQEIISVENLVLAEKKARKGKKKQYGVIVFDRDKDAKIQALHELLKNGLFRTSRYAKFDVFEPKHREVYRLPYYPDRIVHHAVMNILEDIFVDCFTADTYSCIKGRGIHGAARAMRKALNDESGTEYCLKLDIKKFYPSVDHDILKQLLRKKFKDQDLLRLLDEIIDSAPGIPIGNYLSQYFANFYLTYFDHWIKEVKGVKYYFRYADDIVVLSDNKEHLHLLLNDIKEYLRTNLKLEVKGNHQVFPVKSRGIDFVGYVFFHTHTLMRKGIKKNFARMVNRRANLKSIASYYGWAKHCNSKTLIKKLIPYERVQELQYKAQKQRIRRRKDKGRPVAQPENNSP